jgi:hypothetical protein
MSAHREFFEAQQSLNNLFHIGHRISYANVDWHISQLREHAYRMVRYNIEEHNRSSIATTRRIPIVPTQVFTPPPRRNPLEKSKIIAKKKLEESCPQECAVCQDTPKYKDAVCTECNHYYCKSCWSSWINTERSNKNCPTCRKDMPRITTFKARAIRRLIVVEDEDF